MTITLCRNCGKAIQPCSDYGSSGTVWYVHEGDNMIVCMDNQHASHLTVANPVEEAS
jgi:hypothetical protein